MAYSVTASFSEEQAKLEGTYPIEMLVLNASLTGYDPVYMANLNQDVYGYEMNSSGALTATQQVYLGLPLEIQDFSTSIEGKVPEISISVPNVDRSIEAIIQSQSYLRSREIYLISTFVPFLPSGSDYRHLGSTPDKSSAIIEKLYISHVTTNEDVAVFTCKPKFDLRNAQLPRRTYSRECSFEYGSTECDPDSNIDYVTYPTCNFTLADCEERGNAARYGGFVSIPKKHIVIV
jgi:phage-related protein